MKKSLFMGLMLSILLIPLMPVNSAHADEMTNLKVVSKHDEQVQSNSDKQYTVQFNFDPKVAKSSKNETPKISKDELKKISKLQVSDLKNKRTKQFKYHKRNVDQVNKTLTKYH